MRNSVLHCELLAEQPDSFSSDGKTIPALVKLRQALKEARVAVKRYGDPKNRTTAA